LTILLGAAGAPYGASQCDAVGSRGENEVREEARIGDQRGRWAEGAAAQGQEVRKTVTCVDLLVGAELRRIGEVGASQDQPLAGEIWDQSTEGRLPCQSDESGCRDADKFAHRLTPRRELENKVLPA